MARAYFSVRDWSDEYGRCQFLLSEPIGATTIADFQEQLDDLATAINGVSLGQIASQWLVVREGGSDVPPGSALAQREFGLRVHFRGDSDATPGHVTIPCVDISSLDVEQGGDKVTLQDGGPMEGLVTEMENFVRLPYGATVQNITVEAAYIVGRNS